MNKVHNTVTSHCKTRPGQTRPNQCRPDQTRPDQTRPDHTKPDQTKPGPTRPTTNRRVLPKCTDLRMQNIPTELTRGDAQGRLVCCMKDVLQGSWLGNASETRETCKQHAKRFLVLERFITFHMTRLLACAMWMPS